MQLSSYTPTVLDFHFLADYLLRRLNNSSSCNLFPTGGHSRISKIVFDSQAPDPLPEIAQCLRVRAVIFTRRRSCCYACSGKACRLLQCKRPLNQHLHKHPALTLHRLRLGITTRTAHRLAHNTRTIHRGLLMRHPITIHHLITIQVLMEPRSAQPSVLRREHMLPAHPR